MLSLRPYAHTTKTKRTTMATRIRPTNEEWRTKSLIIKDFLFKAFENGLYAGFDATLPQKIAVTYEGLPSQVDAEGYVTTWNGTLTYFPEDNFGLGALGEFPLLEYRITCDKAGHQDYRWEQYINETVLPEDIAVLRSSGIPKFQEKNSGYRVIDSELVTRYLAIKNITGLGY